MPLPIIHINGFPGVGKLTVARELVTLLAPYNAKLVHNHLLIDPAGAILPRTSDDYQTLRRALRAVVFDTLATSKDTFDSVYVFTDFQSTDNIGSAVMKEYRDMAARRGCAFIPIIATCDKDENLRRLTSPERSVHGKLTDVGLVVHIREDEVIHQAAADPFRMEIDLTELDAKAAARLIQKHVLEGCGELR